MGTTDEFGKHNVRTVSGDGYVVDIYRAVAAPGSRRLITPSGSVDEATIDHVQAGGGLIGSGARTKQSGRAEPKIMDLTFEIDFLLFEDGEIAGPDPDQYAREIQVSKTSRGVHRQADSIGNE